MSSQPLTDASAELRTVFTGDVQPLRQASVESERIVNETASRLNQALAQPAAGFENLSQSASQAATQTAQSFNVMSQSGQVAATGINSIGAAAQSVGAQVTTSTGQAAQGLSSVGQSAQAAGAAMSSLDSQVAANVSQMNQMSVQIAQNRVELAGLAQQINASKDAAGKATDQTAALKTQYTQLAGETRTLAAQKQLLNAQTNSLTGATQATTAAQAAAGKSTEQTSKFMQILNGLMTTNTTQISSQGTVWAGYDTTVQAVVRSLGGVTVAWSLAITVAGTLAGKLLDLATAKEEDIKITAQQIGLNQLLANSFQQVTGGVTISTQGFLAFGESASKVAESGVAVNMLAIAEAQREVETTGKKVAFQMGLISTSTELLNAGITGQAQSIRDARNEIKELIPALAEQQKKLADNVEQARILRDVFGINIDTQKQYAAQTGATRAELDAMTRAINSDIDSLRALSAELAKTTDRTFNLEHATLRLAVALQQIRAPKIDVAAIQGVEGAVKNLGNAVQTVTGPIKGGLGLTDGVKVFRAVRPEIEGLRDQLRQQAAATGTTIAETKRLYETYKGQLSPAQRELVANLERSDANMKAFTASAKGAGGASKAARAAVNEYSDGMIGLGRAIELVNKSLEKGTFDILFDKVPAKARGAANELKAAAQQLVNEINEMMSSLNKGQGVSLLGNSVKFTIADLKTLGVEGLKPLQTLVQAYKIAGDEVHSILVKNLIAKPEITVWANVWSQASEEVKAKIKSLGVTIKEVFPESATRAEILNLAFKGIGKTNKEILDQIESDTKLKLARTGQSWDDFIRRLQHNKLKQQLEDIQRNIDFTPAIRNLRFDLEIHSKIESVISDFERWGEQMGLTGRQLEEFVVDGAREALSEVEGITEAQVEQIIEHWRKGLHKLPGIWEDVFGNLPSQTKAVVGDIIGIIDTMPGEIGDSLRQSLNQFEQWMAFINNVFSLLSKVIDGFPSSISDAVDQINVSMKKQEEGCFGVADAAVMASDDWAAAMESMSSSTARASSKTIASLVNIGSAVAGLAVMVGSLIGGRAGRTISMTGQGFLSGAAIGATIGSFFGPGGTLIGAGIGAIGGAIAGFFSGLFGGGKSESQKASEAAQIQQAKDQAKISQQQALQAVEDTKQSLLETASKATELLRSISLHIDIPDEVFDAWFKDLDRLMKGLSKRFEQWSKESSDDLTKSAEEIQAVAGAAAAIAVALNSVATSLGASDAQIELVASSWERLIVALATVEENLANQTEKHAKKLAKRTAEVPGYVAETAEAISAISNLPEISTDKVESFADATELILVELGEVFSSLDRFKLKITGQSAETALPILEFTARLSESLNAAVGVNVPDESDWQQLRTGAEAAINFVIDLFEQLQRDSLIRAAQLSEVSNPILEFVGNVFGALGAGGEIDRIADIDFSAVRAKAKELITAVINLAQEISVEAAAQGAKLSEAAQSIPSFVSDLASAIAAAAETSGAQADIANLKAQGKALIQAVIELSQELSSDGVEAARELSESGIIITEFASSLASAMSSLYESSRAGDFWIRIAVGNFRSMVEQFASLGSDISPQILSAAEDTARRGAGITANVLSISQSLQAASVTNFAHPTAVVLALQDWSNGLADAYEEVLLGHEISESILSLSIEIEANLAAAASHLAAGAQSIVDGLSGVGSGSGFSVASAPLQLSGSPASAQPASTTISVHVDARGAVIDEAKLTDKIMQGIVTLERTARIVRVTR